ncbi:MAG: DUF1428 domain-containing protein [Sphingomonadales bacterium]|nr:DUF1428 domain-containing protein [Sphingomonadales bacterium]
MRYYDVMIYSAPEADRDKVTDYAERLDPLVIEFGALRVIEGWGDDVPHGQQTDFYRAVAAPEGEAVLVGIIEWPDKATRDAGFAKMMADPRMQEPMPFDGKRMIYGGFAPFVDLKA